MLRYLVGKIRQQPKSVRDNIAMGIAGVFTVFIFSIWAYNLPAKMGIIVQGADEGEGTFSELFKQVSEQIATVKEGIPEELPEFDEKNPLNPLVDGYRAAVADSSSDLMDTSTSSIISTVSTSTSSSTSVLDTSDWALSPSSQPELREVRIVTTNPTTTASTSDSE